MEALGVAVESEETKVTKVCTAGSLCFPCRSGLESRSNCTGCSVSQQIGVRHSVTNPSGNLELQHIYIYIHNMYMIQFHIKISLNDTVWKDEGKGECSPASGHVCFLHLSQAP